MSRHDYCMSPRCGCEGSCAAEESALEEREACAKNLEELAELSKMMNDHGACRALMSAADAIRAR